MKELKSLKDFLEKVSQLTTSYEDIGVLIEMAYGATGVVLISSILILGKLNATRIIRIEF